MMEELASAGINFRKLREAHNDEVVKTLVAVPGIGPWTAEIYAMFSLGRADVFAPGDLALQESARLIFDLPTRPTEKELRQMSEDWSPWRAVAAAADGSGAAVKAVISHGSEFGINM